MPTSNKTSLPLRLSGFTLVELLVAMTVSAILVTGATSVYTVFKNAIARDQSKAELNQNDRILMDRLTRELRQTPDIVTPLPSGPADTSVPQPGAIEFEDGHANDLTYQSYYLPSGSTTVQLDTVEYYFASDPTTRVAWNSVPAPGDTLVRHVISTQDVADDIQRMLFYGPEPVQIILTAADQWRQSFLLRSTVYTRNS